MSARLFTPEEVDALVPRLADLMEAAMERHRQAAALQRELAGEQQRIQASGGGLIDQRDWTARAERLDGLTIEVRGLLQEILDLGGVTKDLELGLVDFPARLPEAAGDEVINLCWKHGETRVEFWHGMDEGYAQRKPLP
ncbi:MAG TPA: DUF2203 domain-containing protein [Methylomirabilota bacterium]|nr:DUF2203 domain-containing protein [Methylomirabilota bacterium]